MTDKQKRRLGDVAFLAQNDGMVTRTIVSSVSVKDGYGLLEHSYGPAHFEFEDAVAAVTAMFKKKEQEAEAVLAKIRAQLALVGSAEYKQRVAVAPLKEVSGSIIGAAFGLDGEVEDIPVPSFYFEPGQQVYCVVTPKTHNTVSPHYRPYTYFVLESSVREARLTRGGKVHYRLDSYYSPRAVCADLDEAKKQLVLMFLDETSGTLPLENIRMVSHREEKEANEASTKRIMEQVNRQFGVTEPEKA